MSPLARPATCTLPIPIIRRGAARLRSSKSPATAKSVRSEEFRHSVWRGRRRLRERLRHELAVGTVKKVAPNGKITTIGSGLHLPQKVAVDPAGDVFVSEPFDNVVKEITPDGGITIVGHGFAGPYGVAANSSGVFVADSGHNAVKKITPDGKISEIGSGFKSPWGVALDAHGNVYVTDTGHKAVKKVTPSGKISTLGRDFVAPLGVAVSGGNVFVTDWPSNAVDEILADGRLLPLGMAHRPASPWDCTKTSTSPILRTTRFTRSLRTGGQSVGKGFATPNGVAADNHDNVFVADTSNNAIKKVTPNGTISVVGHGFRGPEGVAVDTSGNIYVADTLNNAVKKVAPDGRSRPSPRDLDSPYHTDRSQSG